MTTTKGEIISLMSMPHDKNMSLAKDSKLETTIGKGLQASTRFVVQVRFLS